MIDVKHLIENPDQYRASQTARGADVAAVDRMIEADTSRRASIASFEELRAEQKAFGKRVAQAQGEEKQALLAEVKELAAQVKAAEAAAGEAEAALAEEQRSFPNLIVDGIPSGGEDDFDDFHPLSLLSLWLLKGTCPATTTMPSPHSS